MVILVVILVAAGIYAATNQSGQSGQVGWTAYPAGHEFTPQSREDCREYWLGCQVEESEGW